MNERNRFIWVPPEKVKVREFRARTTFDPEKMEDLKRSIRRRSMLHPIVVKDDGDESYTLIAGERRLIASRELGLHEIPAVVRSADVDSILIEMGVENIQREDLSFYERGRWVSRMKDRGWTITALAEETGVPHQRLFDWLEFYEESERIRKMPIIGKDFEPEKLPLTGLLETKRAPITEKKKAELAVAASQMTERPTVTEIQKATRIIEQQPDISAKEAIERAKGITCLLPVPADLMPLIRAKCVEWQLSVQEAIIKILWEYLT